MPTRPTWITKAMATAAVAGVTALAAGCGSGSALSSATSVSIGSPVSPPTLDPTANAAAAITEVVDYNIYQHLVQLDPAGQIVPALAQSYSLSSDRKTYTFTLRRGVKFSNGDPLTPADVVFSIKRALSPSSTYPNKAAMGGVVSVKAQGADQVTVMLSQPDNQWLYQLAAYSNGVVLDPRAVGTMATHPVGTGPYELSNFTPNYSLTLNRNPHYWGERPQVSTVTFRYFSNANAEAGALSSGQIQVMDNLSNSNPADVTQFRGNPSYKIIAGPTTGKIQVSLNNSYGPLKNVLVRRAISYAIDKHAIVTTAAAGYGTVLGTNSTPGDPWYTPAYNTAYAYDPAEAKRLLTQAGYPNGFKLTLTLPPYGYAQAAGPLVAADLKAVGINASIDNIQWPLWLSQVFTNHDFQITLVDQALGRDLVHYTLPTYYWQYAGTTQAARLLRAGNTAATTTVQDRDYRQLLKLISNDAVNVWLYDPSQITVADKDIVGLPDSGLAASFDLSHVEVDSVLPKSLTAQGYAG